MMHTESVDRFAAIGADILAGRVIDTSFFGTLELPDVPKNVAMVVMNGPLAKSDVCDAEGSATLAKQVKAAAENSSINAIIVLSENCPGGSVDGTEALGLAVKAAAAQKPVYGMVSGMACSAAYWVLSQCTAVYATSNTDVIGCIGAMARLRNPKANKSEDFIEVYSDLSPDKNAEFKDADTYKKQFLNPMSQLFHDAVMSGRQGKLNLKKENVLSGKTYIAQAALSYGLIDGIMSKEDIIAMAANKRYNPSSTTNTNSMTFEQKFPRLAKILGLAPEAETPSIDEANGKKLDALAEQNEQLTQQIATLTQQLADANKAKGDAEAALATMKTAKEKAERDLATANTKIAELEKLDAGVFAGKKTDKDDQEDAPLPDAMNMDFQKELLNKV